MKSARKVLVLVGPTASSKTSLSIELAKRLRGEILSADSRQIYKHLNVGTAKPSGEQLAAIKHHFVSELSPDVEFNAGAFGEQGRMRIDDILARKKTPIVVGGSGLYVRSLVDGLFAGPGADPELRKRLQQRVEAGELQMLIDELRRVDPISAKHIDPTKPRRVIRALEIFHLTGKPLSVHHQSSQIEISFAPIMFGLDWERKALYDRINRRCDEMLHDGLLIEVEQLERRGFSSSLNALNTVGYAEAFAYRRGEIPYDAMVRLFKQNSRRYAKRQLTWFRRDTRVRWIKMTQDLELKEVAEKMIVEFAES